MIITYYGLAGFKVQLGEKVLAFNPPSKKSKLKTPKFNSDIVLVSINHPDYNGTDGALGENAFVINGPGEYEVGGTFIKGIGLKQEMDGQVKYNTIYSVLFDGINLCHLGALNNHEIITPEIKEKIGVIDILFIPITGGELLKPEYAAKVISDLEPGITIPMTVTTEGLATKELALFLKEAGGDGVEPTDKLSIKKKDLNDKAGEIVILNHLI